MPTDDNRCPQCHSDIATGEGGVRPQNLAGIAGTNYWSFEGRVGRRSFWAIIGSLTLISLLVDLLVLALGGDPHQASLVSVALELPIMVICFWISIATWVKRWHDLNKSGWMVLLNLTILAMPVLPIVLGIVRGTAGANRYGADPLPIQAK
jgi:uncharacterized membrane protein YhaH (DUF805 family)